LCPMEPLDCNLRSELWISKEIITTPFSFIATSSSILWENCEPVFVDIDEETFCIDAKKIEEAITPDVEAILAVHVYGNPCLVAEIERISKKHNLKVIYDAAHAFGVKIGKKSIVEFGMFRFSVFMPQKYFIPAKAELLLQIMTKLQKN